MAATARAKGSFLALALAFVAVVAAVNLIFNLRSFPTFEPAEGEGEQTPLILPFGSDLGVTAVSVLVVSATALGVLLVAFLRYNRRGLRFSLEELLPLLIVLIMVLSLVFFVGPAIREFQDRLEEEPGAPDGAEWETGGELSEVFRERLLRISPALAGIAVIFLGIFGSYILMNSLRRKRWKTLSELLSQDSDEPLRHAIAAIDEGLYRLELGEDVRSSILGCYRDLVALFEGRGLRAEDHLTARELELAAEKDLGLSTKSSRSLRRLFELARYSSHSLTEADREQALNSLMRAKEEMGG